MLDYTYWYDKLVELNIPVLIYAGEWDQRSGANSVEEYLRQNVPLLSKSNIWNQARQIYYIKDANGNFVVGGYFRQDVGRKITILTIPKGGHFVAGDQILISNTFFKDIQSEGLLQCQKDNYLDCYTTLITCDAMNQCNGNGVCGKSGFCQCDDGFKAADCSEKVEVLASGYYKQFVTNGTQWIYFQYKNGLFRGYEYELDISS